MMHLWSSFSSMGVKSGDVYSLGSQGWVYSLGFSSYLIFFDFLCNVILWASIDSMIYLGFFWQSVSFLLKLTGFCFCCLLNKNQNKTLIEEIIKYMNMFLVTWSYQIYIMQSELYITVCEKNRNNAEIIRLLNCNLTDTWINLWNNSTTMNTSFWSIIIYLLP